MNNYRIQEHIYHLHKQLDDELTVENSNFF